MCHNVHLNAAAAAAAAAAHQAAVEDAWKKPLRNKLGRQEDEEVGDDATSVRSASTFTSVEDEDDDDEDLTASGAAVVRCDDAAVDMRAASYRPSMALNCQGKSI